MLRFLAFLFAVSSFASAAQSAETWPETLAASRGQTVFFNAWAGDPRINAYIEWAAEEVMKRYRVNLRHAKLNATSEAVSRVVAEKAAGKISGGTVDLIWINGENFAAMKQNGLLYGPWVERLPNWRYVDPVEQPAVATDFTVPVEGMEAPWSLAQIVFVYDEAHLAKPPRSAKALLGWAEANPGRFTYPHVNNFLGTTFLKQVLYEVTSDVAELSRPASKDNFQKATEPLWSYLERLHPQLWRRGQAFPENGPAQRRLLADGEIDLYVSYNPAEASLSIASGDLPATARSVIWERGTIGNASFLAIPFNANARAGAMVAADFLLSPEAQAKKQDPRVWGVSTVLSLKRLEADQRRRFVELPVGIATLSPEELGQALAEPHPTWMVKIAEAWKRRYNR
ncbi:MAG: ABC transporter substrate-binding protein [Proteobacteria bacterium]|nr:ABC transporter substrate-binding protein [Pseudomonadota bacterium]MBI3498394.1 ABC transporter substrate-binding protein [Pseudomonadota bacterium]